MTCRQGREGTRMDLWLEVFHPAFLARLCFLQFWPRRVQTLNVHFTDEVLNKWRGHVTEVRVHDRILRRVLEIHLLSLSLAESQLMLSIVTRHNQAKMVRTGSG